MTIEKKCKGITSSGKQCKLKADESGYCHIHNPEKIASRESMQKVTEEKRQKMWAKGEKLREVLDVVTTTCRAKGWISYIKNTDNENWRYATVHASRSDSREEVSGLFDITLDDGVKVSVNKTSFYGYGLSQLQEAIMVELGRLSWLEPPKKPSRDKSKDALKQLEQLLKNFHIVARQLIRRYNGRDTLVIKDEYDVQDLLHALLKTIFEDVRPEEYSPSYAGASSRIDFLLKREQIVIEVKMASERLKDKTIGEQLIIDIRRYQTHPDCKTLVCFVYDPNGNIRNPIGLENDLGGKQDKIGVYLFVVPH